MDVAVVDYPLPSSEIWGVGSSSWGDCDREALETRNYVTSGKADQNMEQGQGIL